MTDEEKGIITSGRNGREIQVEGNKTTNINYPGNSHKQRQEQKEKKVEKVVKGSVVQKKKSWGKKLLGNFVNDDVDNVSSYIIHDVLIPAAKSAINDMVQGGIEMILFGEKKSNRTSRDRGRSYVSYNNYSSNNRRDDRRDISQTSRARHDFDDIIFGSRGEAEEVLSNLVDLVIDYKEATVADLYILAGISENFTDRKYGWRDLSSASVSRVRDGYMINLPRTVLLD